MRRIVLCSFALSFFVACSTPAVWADGPGDNVADQVRPVPPAGVEVPPADLEILTSAIAQFAKEIDELSPLLKGKPALAELIPDVQIYLKAVHDALEYHEFFNVKEIGIARSLLAQGRQRAAELREGKSPWTTATGLVVRGYVSKIDGSVQPYGLVVPASYETNTPHRFRLDVWCHGRGENLSELNFINGRQSSQGEFAPANAFVVHPYGRYCNANKFAGEIDLFEAIEHIKQHYPIDENRQVVRGFSMGGAACWQFAVHYPSTWAAAAPGAGFSETAEFLHVFQNESVQPTWYEKKLWHLYDATDYALNLFNCPTVAYSGEIDKQKQAADMMEKALRAEGIQLVHIIGAGAGHKYTPEAKIEISQRIDSLAAAGRQAAAAEVHFTTWTLRYHRSCWVEIDGLDEHWERARIDAELTGGVHGGPKLKTQNVSAVTLRFPAGRCPFDLLQKTKVEIDGVQLAAPQPMSDRSWTAHFRRREGKWQVADSAEDNSADKRSLRKRHGLQGPIDDAFMDSFLMVRPTSNPLHEKVGTWAAGEMRHACEHWRRQFRGVARIKDDKDVSDADIAAHNLILWGDPASNAILARIASKLPIRWTSDGVQVGQASFSAGQHVPVLIYPNPLNPERYVVINSGFTYREYDYLNNARQVPKLPDFAVIDIGTPASSRAPGGVVTAGFFDEQWQLPPAKPQ